MDSQEMKMWIAQFQFKHNRKMRYRLYRKLEGMLRMNEALSRCLDRLYNNATQNGKYPNRPDAIALKEWFLKDRSGITLAEAMADWIPVGELYMIRAGEESGTLANALTSIQLVAAKAKEMQGAISSAVAYPSFMFLLLSAVLWMFGVNLIQNMRASAPANIVAAMGSVPAVSDFIINWGLLTLAGIGIFITIIVVTLPRWQGHLRARFDLYPPWSWYRVMQGSGFLLGLSALLGAQVPLRRALEILGEQGSPWMKERIEATRQEVLRGRNLGEALMVTGYNFPDPAVSLDLMVLSERGDIGTVLTQVTEEWMNEQILSLRAQAGVARTVGLFAVAGTIAWVMMAILNVVQAVMGGGSGGGLN